MNGFVEVHRWLGQVSAPLDPAAMQFRAKLAAVGAGDCAGCLFRGQAAKVCEAAARAAQLAGLKDCDERDTETGRTFVYTLAALDPRQLAIDSGETA
ncbi:hypothetical protein [Massilia antarctica]|uniref:hypothetical protein n=1 Tax=Massilia antarctica TaxID=2765360 RepID=UPI00226E0C46|nr:hypothetical protein [Massilia sp. H27-R4]